MTANLPQICKYEGMEEILNEKPLEGHVDDQKEEVAGGSVGKCQRRLLKATRKWL